MRASSMVLAILALLTVAAGHAADDDGVSGTLANCTVIESGGTFEEMCDLESADPVLAGTWSFRYEVDTSDEGVFSADDVEEVTTFEYEPDDLVLQVGRIVIVTDDGVWAGQGQRVLSAGPVLDDFWADVLNLPGAAGGGAWVIGGHLGGDAGYEGMVLQIGGAGDDAGPPYAIHRRLGSASGYSTAANIGRLAFRAIGLIALAIGGAPAVISGLKGRWWMGVLGFVGAVGGFVIAFGLFGIPEPSEEFQETLAFTLGNAALQLASYGGLLVLVLGSVRPARPGSWWERNRSDAPHGAE